VTQPPGLSTSPDGLDVVRLPAWGRLLLVAAGVVALALAPFVASAPVGLALAAEGALLAALGARGRWRRVPAPGRLPPARPEPPVPGPSLTGGAAPLALAGVTLLALALRLPGIGSDLWLDEIVTVEQYAGRSIGAIFSTYEGANNHLLNSLLVHLSLEAFGEEEWAVRLPALLAGVATVPALYWVARELLGPLPSLLASLALAVAYPHVFFSQNARGYAFALLFGLVSSGFLVRALRADASRDWVLYVGTAVLCVVAVPTGGFVVAGQAAVVAAAVVLAARRGGRSAAAPVAWRGVLAYAWVALLLGQAYAQVVSRASSVAEDAWTRPDAGWAPLSLDFARELLDDATARGPLAAVVVLAAACVGLVGLVSLARRDWALLAALSLGPILNLAFVVARGLVFSPRFLLALLLPALLVAVETIRIGARWAARRAARSGRDPGRASTAVQLGAATVLCAMLALPLAATWGIPKQPYREAVAFARERRGEGVVVAVFTAQAGVRYYGVARAPGDSLVPGVSLRTARSAAALRAIRDQAGDRPLVLVTTFHRALAVGRPRLDAMVRRDWVEAARFRGSVGDGDVAVWVPRRQ
jgi:hypothetical protein